MSCTNPNCECKPGTFANLNPPTQAFREVPTSRQFEAYMLDGLEWQQKVSINTASGKYRVEITWALDRYRVNVWRRGSFCVYACRYTKLIEVRHPLYARTALTTANSLLRRYAEKE